MWWLYSSVYILNTTESYTEKEWIEYEGSILIKLNILSSCTIPGVVVVHSEYNKHCWTVHIKRVNWVCELNLKAVTQKKSCQETAYGVEIINSEPHRSWSGWAAGWEPWGSGAGFAHVHPWGVSHSSVRGMVLPACSGPPEERECENLLHFTFCRQYPAC